MSLWRRVLKSYKCPSNNNNNNKRVTGGKEHSKMMDVPELEAYTAIH